MKKEIRPRLKCAKWCGRGCTFAEFEKAKKNGAALAASLGPRWKFRVFENLGWHHNAFYNNPRIEVFGIPGSYDALIQTTPQFSGKGKTPKAAVMSAIKAVRSHFTELQGIQSATEKVQILRRLERAT